MSNCHLPPDPVLIFWDVHLEKNQTKCNCNNLPALFFFVFIKKIPFLWWVRKAHKCGSNGCLAKSLKSSLRNHSHLKPPSRPLLFGQDAIKTPRIFDRLPDALNCIDLKKRSKSPTACGNSNLEHAINGVTTSNAPQNWTKFSAKKKKRKRQQTFASKFTNSSQTNNYKIHFTW